MSRLPFGSKLGDFRMRTRVLLCAIAVIARVEVSAQEGGYEYQDRSVVRQTVEHVMARPEFQRLRDGDDEESKNPAWLERILDGIGDWIEQWLARNNVQEERDIASGAAYLVYGVAFLIVVAALALILKSVLESAKERALESERVQARLVQAGAAPGETPSEEFWARAQELAARGNEKLAIRELLLGAMSSLERRGLIRHRRGLTNRDYLGAASGDMRSSLLTIVAAFERVYFGRRAASSEGFRECSDAYREGFGVPGPPELRAEIGTTWIGPA